MKFTIVNNQPYKRALPLPGAGGSNIIEPYGTLVFNKPKEFKKSFESLSTYGYSVYSEEDKNIQENIQDELTIKPISTEQSLEESKGSIEVGDTTLVNSTIILEVKDKKEEQIEQKQSDNNFKKPVQDELTIKVEESSVKEEKPILEDNSNKESDTTNNPEEIVDNEVKEELSKEDIKEVSQIQETRESVLNKCKTLSAESLRALLREIGINSTSNNTNTLFNKISNSETTDDVLISAYHKIVDSKE